MKATLLKLRTPWRLSIVQFAATGALSTVIDIAILNLVHSLGGHEYVAAALGFVAGSTNGYFINSKFVFAQSWNRAQYQKYFFVAFVGLLLTEFIIDMLHVRNAHVSLNEAKLVAVAIVFFWNYSLSKLWAFK